MKLALAIAASLIAAYFGLYALRRYQDTRPVEYESFPEVIAEAEDILRAEGRQR